MKKVKLSLKTLSVKSFITTLSADKTQTVKGGDKEGAASTDLRCLIGQAEYINVEPSQGTSFKCGEITGSGC